MQWTWTLQQVLRPLVVEDFPHFSDSLVSGVSTKLLTGDICLFTGVTFVLHGDSGNSFKNNWFHFLSWGLDGLWTWTNLLVCWYAGFITIRGLNVGSLILELNLKGLLCIYFQEFVANHYEANAHNSCQAITNMYISHSVCYSSLLHAGILWSGCILVTHKLGHTRLLMFFNCIQLLHQGG